MPKEEKIEGKIKEEFYSRDELISFSKQLFGVNSEVVYGALAESPKKELGIEEAKSLIQQFLKRRVK